MYYYLVAPSTVIRMDQDTFTYHNESPLAIGTLVRVSVGKKMVNGVIIGQVKIKPRFKTKPIDSVLDMCSLPVQLIDLAMWLSKYYVCHLGTVLQTVLPSGMHKQRRQSLSSPNLPVRKRTNLVLNPAQLEAIRLARTHKTGAVLLHGVTGSGKTQVYIELVKHEIEQGRSSIILVPEIALTPQLVAEFKNHFKRVIVTHSGMTESARHAAWLECLHSDQPTIVIGPRSALFMPLKHLGLIVLDECHEPSYKQDQSPRYSALRASSILARLHKNTTVVLGSATPTVADYYLAKTIHSPILTLPKPAVSTQVPKTVLVDTKNRDSFREHRFISDDLLEAMRQAIAKKQQIMIFHNRRGTTPTTLCASCGWSALCVACQVPLTLHADTYALMCHLCGTATPVPPNCPSCSNPDIIFRGIGTKLVEEEVKKLFPKSRVSRFDADNPDDETLQAKYQQLYDGEIDILIGTQLLAKGLDLPHLGVVGVIQADSGLLLPDYQAEERVFQLLYQVAGRVGRSKHTSTVVIQTYTPDHPIIQLALKRNYAKFYEYQLNIRRQAAFPPFTYLLKLTCTYKTEKGAIRAAHNLAQIINQQWPHVAVLGPTPAFYERLGGNYRWQLLVKSKRRAALVEIAAQLLAQSHWQTDIDPVSLS